MLRSFAAALLAILLSVVPASAESHANGGNGHLTLSATGVASAAPDMATVSLNVLKQAETAREALSANNDAMAKVLESLSQAGVAPKDMQTSNLYIQPIYARSVKSIAGYEQQKITAYSVSNSLSVRIRDLTKLGDILDKSVSLGVNQGGQIRFGHSDPQTYLDEARKLAVANAIARATIIAEAANVTLGNIVKISEQSNNRPRPMAEMAMARSASKSVPIAGGETGYSVTVTMEWALNQ